MANFFMGLRWIQIKFNLGIYICLCASQHIAPWSGVLLNCSSLSLLNGYSELVLLPWRTTLKMTVGNTQWRRLLSVLSKETIFGFTCTRCNFLKKRRTHTSMIKMWMPTLKQRQLHTDRKWEQRNGKWHAVLALQHCSYIVSILNPQAIKDFTIPFFLKNKKTLE